MNRIPPHDDQQQRSQKGGDQVLERHLQIAEPQNNAEGVKDEPTDQGSHHSHAEVHHPAKAILLERHLTFHVLMASTKSPITAKYSFMFNPNIVL